MKLLAAALVGALIAGTVVYLWRDAELDARQARLLEAATAQTEAEIAADRLRSELAHAEAQLEVAQAGVCSGIRRERMPRITYVQEGRLLSVSPEGHDVTCLLETARIRPFPQWGPRGDRLLMAGVSYLGGNRRKLLEDPKQIARWSRPRGESVIYTEDNRARLMKVPAGGGAAQNISFLTRHDAFVYHPAGTHIAAAGADEHGRYGIYIATNVGTKRFLVARGENAQAIGGLEFSPDGRHLFFIANHSDGTNHIHDLQLATGRDLGELDKPLADTGIDTLLATTDPLSAPVVSPFSKRPRLSFVRGQCDTKSQTYVWRKGDDAVPIEWPVSGEQTRPVGWVPNGQLLVEVGRAGSCAGGGSLQAWDQLTEERSLIAADVGVGHVAVRATLPKSPEPPLPAQEVPA